MNKRDSKEISFKKRQKTSGEEKRHGYADGLLRRPCSLKDSKFCNLHGSGL